MKKYSYLDMVKTLIPPKEFETFAQSYTQPLKKSIKILKSSQLSFSHIREQLEKDGRMLTPPAFSRKGKPYDDVLFVDKQDKHSLGSHPLHQKGAFYVQEMAAGLPAQLLNVQAEDIILDMCAAPGGKSIQLADKLASS
jgi:16S rRNA C967 or C1407 C5-methylase (RsmB/RsmF family)